MHLNYVPLTQIYTLITSVQTLTRGRNMGMHTITLEQAANVPRKVLFQLLSDHDNLGRFFDAKYSLVKHGKPEINGIGAIRKVTNGPFTFQEQIIDYKENEHLQYKIIDGSPIEEHGGWIRFKTINASRSLILYRINFTPRIRGTGWLIKLLLEKNIKRALHNIAQFSETKWKHNASH